MESVAVSPTTEWPRVVRRLDRQALSTWVLAGGLVLYLALEGGGYDLVVRSQVTIVVWWLVLVGAAWGLLPATRLTRSARVGLVLFGGFVAWTALASTWSLSSERSLQELSRVAGYFGVLLLGVAIHRDRERAVRDTVNAIAAAIVLVACLALVSRLRPGLFAGAQQTAAFLPGTEGRLGWPLNYWNALAAMIALALPLLLAIATSARRLVVQAAAAAAIPIVTLCGYLTLSRGGAIADAAALIVFFALTSDRIPKLATALVAAAGSTALILGTVHRSAIEHGLANSAARHQGSTLLIATVLVCVGVGLAQAGIGLAGRHGTPARWMTIPRAHARRILVGAVAGGVVLALLLGGPSKLAHTWQTFKYPTSAALHQDSISRFGTASGNGRYDYWKVAVKASGSNLVGGSGPGTFQLLWLPRAPYESYVENAHSLYVETLAEVGVIGIALLAGFFLVVLGAAVSVVIRSSYEARAYVAGLTAAMVAFLISAGFDWIWQVPVLPAAFLLLAAAVLAPRSRSPAPRSPLGSVAVRAGMIVGAVLCLAAIAVPLADASAVRQSQAAVRTGDQVRALADARTAARLEPSAAAPQLQLALVLELQRNVRGALIAARSATGDEPDNWSAWLVLSRLDAEARRPMASLVAYRRARALNPKSPLFKQ